MEGVVAFRRRRYLVEGHVVVVEDIACRRDVVEVLRRLHQGHRTVGRQVRQHVRQEVAVGLQRRMACETVSFRPMRCCGRSRPGPCPALPPHGCPTLSPSVREGATARVTMPHVCNVGNGLSPSVSRVERTPKRASMSQSKMTTSWSAAGGTSSG